MASKWTPYLIYQLMIIHIIWTIWNSAILVESEDSRCMWLRLMKVLEMWNRIQNPLPFKNSFDVVVNKSSMLFVVIKNLSVLDFSKLSCNIESFTHWNTSAFKLLRISINISFRWNILYRLIDIVEYIVRSNFIQLNTSIKTSYVPLPKHYVKLCIRTNTVLSNVTKNLNQDLK